jgi:hypothetical protein
VEEWFLATTRHISASSGRLFLEIPSLGSMVYQP